MRVVIAVSLLLVTCGAPPKRCTAETCATGCCSNDVCLDGTSAQACGRGGALCETCSPLSSCQLHACTGTGESGGSGGSGGSTGGGAAGGAAGGSSGGAAGGSAGGS